MNSAITQIKIQMITNLTPLKRKRKSRQKESDALLSRAEESASLKPSVSLPDLCPGRSKAKPATVSKQIDRFQDVASARELLTSEDLVKSSAKFSRRPQPGRDLLKEQLKLHESFMSSSIHKDYKEFDSSGTSEGSLDHLLPSTSQIQPRADGPHPTETVIFDQGVSMFNSTTNMNDASEQFLDVTASAVDSGSSKKHWTSTHHFNNEFLGLRKKFDDPALMTVKNIGLAQYSRNHFLNQPFRHTNHSKKKGVQTLDLIPEADREAAFKTTRVYRPGVTPWQDKTPQNKMHVSRIREQRLLHIDEGKPSPSSLRSGQQASGAPSLKEPLVTYQAPAATAVSKNEENSLASNKTHRHSNSMPDLHQSQPVNQTKLTPRQVSAFWQDTYEAQLVDRMQPIVKSMEFKLDMDTVPQPITVMHRFVQDVKELETTSADCRTMDFHGKRSVKAEYFLHIMLKKCQDYASGMFDLTRKELEEKYSKAETFHNYETRLLKELGIKKEDLPMYFIELLKREKDRVRQDLIARILEQTDTFAASSGRLSLNGAISFESSGDGKQEPLPKKNAQKKKSSLALPQLTRRRTKKVSTRRVASIANIQLNTQREVIRGVRPQVPGEDADRHNTLMDKAQRFLEKQVLERMRLEKDIQLEKEKAHSRNYPHMCQDLRQLVDDNLPLLVESNEVYEQIYVQGEEERKKQEIKDQAAELTAKFEGKAEERRGRALQDIKQLGQSSLMHLFIGNKRDQLVLKFIGILRKRVENKRHQLRKKANEQLIENLTRYHSKIQRGRQLQFSPVKQVQQLARRNTVRRRSRSSRRKSSLVPKAKLLGIKSEVEISDRSRQTINALQKLEEASSPGMRPIQPDFSSCSSSGDENEIQFMPLQTVESFELTEEEIMKEYQRNALATNHQPMQLFKIITESRTLPIANYELNEQSIMPLSSVLHSLVPYYVRKIYLSNNEIMEEDLLQLLYTIFQTSGLTSFGLVRNPFGGIVFKELARRVIPAESFARLRKFVLKDPKPSLHRSSPANRLVAALNKKASQLPNLKKLVLCKIGLNERGLASLAQVVLELPRLEHLNISTNLFNALCLRDFISTITPANHLRTLDLSYNSGFYSMPNKHLECSSSSFEASLADFMSASMTLLHLDISGMNMSLNQLLYIAQLGIRKSRTLLAVHLSGMGLLSHELLQLRNKLNINFTNSMHPTVDMSILKRFHLGKIHVLEMNKLLGKTQSRPFKSMEQWVDQQQHYSIHEWETKKFINKPVFKVDESDKIVFQRILGRSEMIGSHRWVESSEKKCLLCSKMTYCLVMWNKRAAEMNYHDFYFSRSDKEPIMMSTIKYNHPLLCTKDTIYRMLPIREFIERIKVQTFISKEPRQCESEEELIKFRAIQTHIAREIHDQDTLHPTYWHLLQRFRVRQCDDSEAGSGSEKEEVHQNDLMHYVKELLQLNRAKAFQPFNFTKYTKLITSAYGSNLDSIVDDTYVCGFFVADNAEDKKNLLGFGIKHQAIKGVDYVMNVEVPRLKHMSPNTLGIHSKLIKKEKLMRYFRKPLSVFAHLKEDCDELLKKAFYLDIEQCKLPRFIKNQEDRELTIQALEKHYAGLKNEFNSLITNPKTYPGISWLDFADTCIAWKVMDKNLGSSDIDRIFIASTYGEQHHGDSDAVQLNRHAFLETLVRMAKCKYYEKDVFPTMHEATAHLLSEFIVPNSQIKMEGQRFRAVNMYNTETAGLIQANLIGIHALYAHFATYGKELQKHFSKDNALKLLDASYETGGAKLFQGTYQLQVKKVVTAYSLCKMTIVDESKDYSSYFKLKHVEFYEFLCRWAELVDPTDEGPFVEKLEKLLTVLMQIVDQPLFKPVSEKELESDSDYDDDLVEDIVQIEMR